MIEYTYNSKSYTLSTRDVSSCASEIVTVTLNSISSIFIKVKRLNSSSNYSITVSNTSTGTSTEFLWELVVAIGASVFVLVVIAIISTIIIIIVWSRSKANIYREVSQDKEKARKHVENTLNKMNNGEFRYCNQRYQQDNWAIWLESFAIEDKVHITNEWEHINIK